MREKIKTSLKIILAVFIVLFGILSCLGSEVYANIKSTENGHPAMELFKEFSDNRAWNWDGVPWNLFIADGFTLWCARANTPIQKYTTVPESWYWAWKNKTTGLDYWNEANPYWRYQDAEGKGVGEGANQAYSDFRSYMLSQYGRFNVDWLPYPINYGILDLVKPTEETLISASLRDNLYNTEYDTQTGELVYKLVSGMPKKKNKYDVLYSLKYVYDQTLLNKNAQRELFIFTQDKSYFNNPSGVPRNPESFTEEQKEKGYFTVKEKQWALWHDTHPAKSDSVKSRGLSQYADAYEKFYKAVYDGTEEGKYKNLVHALPVDMKTGKPVENSPEMAGNITETVTDELDGDTNLKTFEYKKSLFQADTKNNCYVIGPYCIDYSLDDETGDVFKTTDGYDLRYNSIEDIKVYNQDKKNIEDLGGSFKLAYKYDGELKEEDEAKVHHINDETYLELTHGNEVKTDWEEIPGFDSRKPFYIIVYRGSMKLEDFKGFYAKITFQYIDHIEGTVEKYKGQVYEYYFTSMTRAS